MFGQKIVLDRAVAAAGAAQPGDAAPIVVERYVFCRQRREHDDRTAAIFRLGALHHRAAHEPFGMADAAVEAPAAVEPEPARLAHGTAGREKGNRRGRDVAAGEDRIEAGLRQESAERSDPGRADHGAPPAGEVVIGKRFEHQHLGDRVGLGAADGRRQLEPEHAGVAQGGNRFRRKRAKLFAVGAGRPQCGADAFDLLEQKRPLGVAVLWKLLDHRSPLLPRLSRVARRYDCYPIVDNTHL